MASLMERVLIPFSEAGAVLLPHTQQQKDVAAQMARQAAVTPRGEFVVVEHEVGSSAPEQASSLVSLRLATDQEMRHEQW